MDVATAGAIGGRVVLHGAAPRNAVLQMTSDAFCMSANPGHPMDEAVIVGPEGALQNVFVWVRDGLSGYGFDTPRQPVRVEQKGCRFTPHVTGLQVAQPLELVSEDATLHNVHASARANDEFNVGLAEHQSITRTFAAAEVMVTLRCDVHSWMKAYVGVVAHPFFAVTGADGRFDLKGLPPGEYVIEAWHEKFGTRTQRVSLGARETREIMFTLAAM